MAATADLRARPFAVIDIGSNSIRLVVYEGLERAPLPLFNEKSLCALGRGLAATGRLGEEPMACALRALRRFCHLARAMGSERLDIVATEAVRRARNGDAFLRSAEAVCDGVPVTVLSGADEARTAAMGVAYSFFEPAGVSGDLGGGSIDLAAITPEGPQPPFGSLPLGTLPVGEAMAQGRSVAERLIEERLAALPDFRGAARGKAFYVVGGGWRALCRIRLGITDAPLKVVHDYALTGQEAVTLGRTIAGLTGEELATVPGLPRRRIETVPAAALLFARVVEWLEPERVVFSAFGLREGRLFAQLPAEELARDPLLAGTEAFGRGRSRVAAIGEASAAWTEELLAGETRAQRRIRLAVCALSDTAWREHPDSRALEAFFRLVQYPFIGLGHAERVFLAYALFRRYQGSPADPFIRPFLALLDDAERRRAEILGAALQLAYRISGGVPDLLTQSRLELADGEIQLRLGRSELAPEHDMLRNRLRTLARAVGIEQFKVAA